MSGQLKDYLSLFALVLEKNSPEAAEFINSLNGNQSQKPKNQEASPPPTKSRPFLWPKPQKVYVNEETGEIGIFDSWAKYPLVGTYKISNGKFIRMNSEAIREATQTEIDFFMRSKKAGIEASIKI